MTAVTWKLIGVVPPCTMVAFVVCPLASDRVKSGGPLSPQPAKVSGKTHITAVTSEIHRPRLRSRSSIRPNPLPHFVSPLRCRIAQPIISAASEPRNGLQIAASIHCEDSRKCAQAPKEDETLTRMHRWSQLFIPTLREAPADAEVASHKFLLRSGYVRQLSAGIYSYLFLGQRSLNKIIAIVRQEMDKIGQEFFLPALLPRDLLEESGRWTIFGDNLFRLKDRKGAELGLGMTHEEVMTSIARNELRSYKQLPQIWYQIQTKFRDEPRPKGGLLRVRQFTMKDAYSFDIDAAGLDQSYRKHDQTYRAIFTRCGLSFVVVEADSGAMGGSGSQEFMVYTDAGEDLIASCAECHYAANIEKATSRLAAVEDLAPTGDGQPERIHTPGKAAIADIVAFLNMLPQHDIKTLAYMALAKDGKWKPLAVFLRGDHSVNEAKLLGITGARELRYMGTEELETWFKGPAGYLGPVGLTAAKQLLPVRHRRPHHRAR